MSLKAMSFRIGLSLCFLPQNFSLLKNMLFGLEARILFLGEQDDKAVEILAVITRIGCIHVPV